MYRAQTPIKEMEEALQVSRPTIFKYVNSAGIKNRYSPRPDHTVWHGAFDKLTDEAAYWVGLLITDGCVHRQRRIKLSLQERDSASLDRLAAFVRTTARPGKIEKGSRGLRFTSPRMCARLAELGVGPRKTKTAKAPSCLLDNRHFWRGVIDGDGTLVLGKASSPRVSLTAYHTAPLLAQWSDVCSRLTHTSQHARRRQAPSNVADVSTDGHAALVIARWLYEDCSPDLPVLERKLDSYRQMVDLHTHREVSSSGKYKWGTLKKSTSLDKYRTATELVINKDEWRTIRANNHNTNDLARLLADATEGLPMPDADITEDDALSAFYHLRATSLDRLLEQGPLRLLRSPPTTQPDYHTKLKSPGGNSSNYFFHRLRLKTPKQGAKSPWEKWHDAGLRYLMFQKFLRLKGATEVRNSKIRMALHATGSTPAQFKPGVAKAVYELTGARRILDFSMGWGDRLAGFCASPDTTHYTGIDPNSDLHPLYHKQVALYGASKDVRLIHSPAEDVDLPSGAFDLVLTSPPYFGAERYATGSPHQTTQSWHRYPSPERWRDGFLHPVLARAWSALQPGGILAINLADIDYRGGKLPLCSWLLEAVSMLPDAHFLFALGMRLQGGNYSDKTRADVSGEPIWMWCKGPRSLPSSLPGLECPTPPTIDAKLVIRDQGAQDPASSDDDDAAAVTVQGKTYGHRGSPPTPDGNAQHIIDDYLKGEGSTTVARRYGVSAPTVRSILRRNGHEPRKFTPRRKADLVPPNEKPPA